MAERPSRPLLLDTHVWLWAVEGDESRLSGEAIAAIEAASRSGGIIVSAISVWEVAMLVAKDRLSLARPLDDWVGAALTLPGAALLPLTPEIAVESTRLPGAPPADPADRMLVAGARMVGARLATCDRRLIRYGAGGHVEVLDGRR